MSSEPLILRQFLAALDRDRNTFVQPWMTRWEYQDRNAHAGIKYAEKLPQDFYGYRGPQDLLTWFHWARESKFPDYFSDEVVRPLCDLSRGRDWEILRSHGLEYDQATYDQTFGRYNAQDYLFQNLYPVPTRQKVQRVLDFGAGFGRQSNLWTQRHPELVYVGMDGIPLSYCLQNLYYSGMQVPVREYVTDPATFSITDDSGIYHLPTWRSDLLADNWFDLVLCVQVLPEINETLLTFMLEVFTRVLKPGGALYIRDHDLDWKPANACDINQMLVERGFELEFRPRVIDRQEIHGVPRIWRKPLTPKVERTRISTASQLKHRIAMLDQSLGGFATRLYRALKRKSGTPKS